MRACVCVCILCVCVCVCVCARACICGVCACVRARARARVCVCRGGAGWGGYRDMFFHMIFILSNFVRICFYYVIVNYAAAGDLCTF